MSTTILTPPTPSVYASYDLKIELRSERDNVFHPLYCYDDGSPRVLTSLYQVRNDEIITACEELIDAAGFVLFRSADSPNDLLYVKDSPEEVEQTHATMVQMLIKPGEDLHEVSTAQKWSLVHAALGISGEVAELQWLENEEEHLLEESGDLLFYCRDLRLQLKLPPVDVTHGILPIVWWAGVITDVVKKVAIYGQELDATKADKIKVALDTIETYTEMRLVNHGYTRLDALRHNINKLWKGDKARYASGTYSDKAAAARSDKEGSHE
jgi:hypothetical protein